MSTPGIRRQHFAAMTEQHGAPASYNQLLTGDLIAFGSGVSEWRVLEDRPGPGQLMVECIKGNSGSVGTRRLLVEDETPVWRLV